jgi:acetylornithine deacetylase/succinyl-diaminopimelate desuccinylase-like protein
MGEMSRSTFLLSLFFFAATSSAAELTAHQRLTFEIYKELVEIRTVHPDGDNTAAARAMEARLLKAGFEPKDVQVFEPAPRKGNLVARYRGTGELKPLLLLAHIDVVEALKQDWSDGLDPFKLTERDGYYYGRGVIDDKAMAANFVANLIRYRQEGLRPRRDIIVALTADEEGGTHNGVAWLLKNHPGVLDAELALNEGAGGQWRGGKPFLLGVQVSEKVPRNYDLAAVNAGGHSSVPMKDNAIYDLAAALDRLSRFEFPIRLNYVSRGLAARMVDVETGEKSQALAAIAAGNPTPEQIRLVSSVPQYNAQLRTTCVATMLSGGHAANALPQSAKATVNCRIIPGETAESVEQTLGKVAGEKVVVKMRPQSFGPSEPSDPQSSYVKTIQRISEEMWPGVGVGPVMSTGATDGSRLRNAGMTVYGVSGIFVEFGENRTHGRDERVAVRSFYDSNEFLYRLAKALAAGD